MAGRKSSKRCGRRERRSFAANRFIMRVTELEWLISLQSLTVQGLTNCKLNIFDKKSYDHIVERSLITLISLVM